MQGSQQSGSRIDTSIGVHASNNENSDYENDDFPPKVSKMKDLKHPADSSYQNESDVDVTILSDEESDVKEVEDYHMYFLKKFKKLQTRFSRKSRKISLQSKRSSKRRSSSFCIDERRESIQRKREFYRSHQIVRL